MMHTDNVSGGDGMRGQRAYGAYGSHLSTGGASAAYAGQVFEDLPECYFLRSRAFMPRLRRFVSRDGLSPFDAGGLNRYAYCGGDPINRVDPQGSAFWRWLSDAARWIGDAAGRARSATVSTVTAGLAGVMAPASVGVGRGAGLREHRGAIAGGKEKPLLGNLGGSSGPHGLAFGHYWKKYKPLPDGRNVFLYTFTEDAVSSATLEERGFRSGRDMVTGQLLRYIKPMWTPVPNGAGGTVYLSDAMTTNYDVVDLVEELASPDGIPDKTISILFGAHGDVGGDLNWKRSSTGLYRAGGDSGLVGDFEKFWPDIQRAATGRMVNRHDIGGMTRAELYSHMRTDEIVIYSTCYGLSDHQVMDMLDIREVDVFKLI